MNENEQNWINYDDKNSSKRLFNLIILKVYAIYSVIFGTFIIFEIIVGAIGDVTFFSFVGAIFILSGILLFLFFK